MSEVKKRIEVWFEVYGHWVFRHHWLALFASLAIVVGFGSQVPKIKFDTSTESFFHEDDPILLTYNEFRSQFGRDEFVVIAIEPPAVFDQAFLKKLKAFHEDLEDNVPHIDEITSMINARNTRGEEDQLIVEDLLETWPEDEEALKALQDRVMGNPLYLNTLISEHGRLNTIIIRTNTYSAMEDDMDALEGFDEEIVEEFDSPEPEFLTDQENSDMVRAIQKVMSRYEGPDFKLYLAGSPVIYDTVKRSMTQDARRFVILALITIGTCLTVVFRRVTGVFIPLLIVVFSLITTTGLMAMLGVAFTLPTNILPPFILAVGVGAAVHLLAIFCLHFEKTGRNEEAICFALGHSGLAIVLTSLTTAAGLASFSTAEVAPLAHLGIFASFGVIAALIYTLLLVPSLLAIIPVKRKTGSRKKSGSIFLDRFLTSVADFSIDHAKSLLVVSIIISLFSFAGMLRLSFSHNILVWLPKEAPIRVATEKVDNELRGSVVMEVVIDTGRENGLYELDVLNKMESIAGELETFVMDEMSVGKTISLTDMIKEIHRALNENRSEFYAIPQDPKLIPQELLLFENSGSDDLEDFVDSQFRLARFTIKCPWQDAVGYMPFLTKIDQRFREVFEGSAEITTTGLIALQIRTFYAAIHSAARSYVIAFVVITFMMILLLGNFRMGLISMVPNLLPIMLTMGIIGWLDFPLDMFTMLVGSIAIGLAVDDTVHFMHNFRRYYHESGDVRQSVRETLKTSGRAMLVTTIVLAIGFFIFMFATMNNLYFFGLLTGITIIVALLADFLLAPAMMTLVRQPDAKT